MAEIHNPGLRDKSLPTGHIVPRQGVLITTNDVIRCPDNAPFLNGQVISGALLVHEDPDPEIIEAKPAAAVAEAASAPATPDASSRQKKG